MREVTDRGQIQEKNNGVSKNFLEREGGYLGKFLPARMPRDGRIPCFKSLRHRFVQVLSGKDHRR